VKPTDEFIERYRAVGLDRLTRVETAWFAITQGAGSDQTAEGLRRDLHTLKGDSALLGFDGVSKLCQRLEDLVSWAAEVEFVIGDELDLLVTMALQFAGMILRAPAASPLTGIDLPGFLAQVDASLARTREPPSREPTGGRKREDRPSGRMAALRSDDAVSQVRERLARAATISFVEYCNARGKARGRLRKLWLVLRQEVEALPLVSIGELLEQNVGAARALADTLKKRVRISLEHEPVRVPPAALDSLSTALVHGMRNAIDHGIEPVAVRRERGKPDVAHIRVTARRRDEQIEIAVEDDGNGIDFAAVERAARERQLIGAGPATQRELTDVVFKHGFSTRAEATEVSGRGVGLDAVKQGIEKVGGTVELTTQAGHGTRVVVRVPIVTDRLDVLRFRCPGAALAVAVSADWRAELERDPAQIALGIDVLRIVQLDRDAAREDEPPLGALKLTRGHQTVRLLVASEPEAAVARRPCPTGDTGAVEVVSIRGVDAVLVRPERAMELPKAREGANALAMDRTRRHLILRAALTHANGTIQATTLGAAGDAVFVRTDDTLRAGEPVKLTMWFPRLLEPRQFDAYVAARHAGASPGEPAGLTLGLPLHAHGQRTQYQALVGGDPGPRLAQPLRVLVADRNPTLLAAYAAAARRHEAAGGSAFELDAAADTGTAWRLLEGGHYHLALIDHDLADGRSDRLLARIRATARTANLPVLAVCVAGQASAAEATTAGADVFLDKPLPLADVFFTIDYLYRRRQQP
jgi:two-component system chemotaxis sensor kinase CheA